MRLRNLFIATSLAGLGVFGIITTAMASPVSTEEFVKKVSVANEFEIETSKLALEKSQNKDVKRFADHMIADHTSSGDELKGVLQSYKSGLQMEQKLDDSHQKMMTKLQSLTTDNFNHEYVTLQTNAHEEAIALFSDYSENGGDPAVRKFAVNTLPTLKQHLQQVKEIKIKE